MSNKQAKITEKDYVALCNGINTQLTEAYNAIKGLRDNYKALMDGDKEGPYWNGAVASSFYKTAKANLHNAITAYDDAVKCWTTLRDYYAKLLKKGVIK